MMYPGPDRKMRLVLIAATTLALAACGGSDVAEVASDGGLLPSYEVAPPVPIADTDAAVPTLPPPTPDARPGPVRGPAAVCGSSTSPTVVYQEIAVGQPDFIALRNVTGQVIDLEGYTLVLSGINPSAPREHVLPAGLIIAPKQILYIFEYEKGAKADDVNMGTNIPFYDGPPSAPHANAAVLYDGRRRLLDYVAIGPEALNLPLGASFSPLSWPEGFDGTMSSFQRQDNSGRCPAFDPTDWDVAPVTR